MELLSQNSRTAALFGVVGMVIGAFGAAFIEETLERDREIERDLFRTRLEAVRSYLKGTAESYAARIKDEKERSSTEKINYGRLLIAVAGNDELVEALSKWVEFNEQKTNCKDVPDIAGASGAFFEMRKALLGEQLGNASKSMVSGVALHCRIRK
ncbi:MAG: hypothetical protein ACR2OX_09765 [Methyloligellaceae bacterium]